MYTDREVAQLGREPAGATPIGRERGVAAKEGYTLIVGLGVTGMSCVRHLSARRQPVVVADSRTAPPQLEALRREFPRTECRFGAFDPALFEGADCIVLSPGVSPDEPAVMAAKNRGVEIIGDIEIFAREAKAPVAAISGSNGKSTVTSLVGEMARAARRTVAVGGNLGPPALELITAEPPDLFVLELSSFQLETTNSLQPAAATVLNVSPDHMDRHRNFERYAAVKRRIFRGAGVMVINRDDAVVAAMASPERACIGFSLRPPAGGDFGLVETGGEVWIAHGDETLIAASELPLPGLHNVANCLAALAMGEGLGIPMEARLEALKGFRGLPHRCELVAERAGVRWYDDSKGTNVGATVAAIRGLGAERPLVLIAGGVGKGADFAPLREPVGRHVRHVVLLGRDADRIEAALADAVDCTRVDDLADAVRAAAKVARAGDAVLFSPACASFDMFENYAARGRAFAAAVRSLVSS